MPAGELPEDGGTQDGGTEKTGEQQGGKSKCVFPARAGINRGSNGRSICGIFDPGVTYPGVSYASGGCPGRC